MTRQSKHTPTAVGLARVDGDGSLHVYVTNTHVENVRLDTYEPPRFFEALPRGRSCTEPADITARVCRICTVAYHTSAFLGIDPGPAALAAPAAHRAIA